MARSLRLSFEDAVYHITARGNRKENIFYSDEDRKTFLNKMNETFEKFSFRCYAYCLMDNHYHLFLKTPHANLPDGMHQLNATYANWFRTKYKLAGPVFRGRYKSILVDEDSYALTLSAYIHLNPVRAGLVKFPGEYMWSSFLDYLGKRKPLIKRLDTSFILNQFGDSLKVSRARYGKFVIDNADLKNPLEKSYKNIALGDEKFIDRIKEKVGILGPMREVSHIKDIDSLLPEQVMDAISEQFNIDRGVIFEKKRGNLYRKLALCLLKKYSLLSLKQIGKMFKMDYVAVSVAVKRFENEIKNNRKALEMKGAVLKRIKGKEIS